MYQFSWFKDDDYETLGGSLDKKEIKKECGVRPSKLNAQLKGLIGAANTNIVKGEIETAEQMCLEVIV